MTKSLKEIIEKEHTDVVGGALEKFDEILWDVKRYMSEGKSRIIVYLEKQAGKEKPYYSTIYIKRKEFGK